MGRYTLQSAAQQGQHAHGQRTARCALFDVADSLPGLLLGQRASDFDQEQRVAFGIAQKLLQ